MTDWTEDYKYLVKKGKKLRTDSERLRADITHLRAEIIRLTEISNELRTLSNKLIAENKQVSDSIANALSGRKSD
jgi:hypothetical protein